MMPQTRKIILLSLIVGSALVVSACGNYTGATRAARDEFYSGKFTDAASALEKGAHEEGVDQLLYLFDRATALHQAGDYEESNKDFHQADKLAEIKDYTSLSAEAATLVSSDRIIPYKGEDFEKVLISQYLAINYLMLRKYEDALVECRRVNHKLHMMISVGKRKYKLNPFANYLAALMYEDQKEWNDAYVDYKNTRDVAPDFPYLGEDLFRLAWKNNIREDMEQWAKEYHLSADDKKRIRESSKLPEIVVIVENGKSPEKQPHPSWYSIPHYVSRHNPVSYAQISINGADAGRSQALFDVEKTAIENLDEKYAGILAKKIAGVAVKEVVAHQVGKHTDPIVGALLRLGMYAADQADLRSWLTLPKNFQIFRARVAPGESYKIQVQARAVDGSVVQLGSGAIEKIVHFEKNKPNQRVFVHVRLL